MPDFDFARRMAEICEARGITLYRWWKNTHLSQSTFYNIAKGRSKSPRWNAIREICGGVDMEIHVFFSVDQYEMDIPNSRKATIMKIALSSDDIYNRVVSYYEGAISK